MFAERNEATIRCNGIDVWIGEPFRNQSFLKRSGYADGHRRISIAAQLSPDGFGTQISFYQAAFRTSVGSDEKYVLISLPCPLA